jgi:hypothetical protein
MNDPRLAVWLLWYVIEAAATLASRPYTAPPRRAARRGGCRSGRSGTRDDSCCSPRSFFSAASSRSRISRSRPACAVLRPCHRHRSPHHRRAGPRLGPGGKTVPQAWHRPLESRYRASGPAEGAVSRVGMGRYRLRASGRAAATCTSRRLDREAGRVAPTARLGWTATGRSSRRAG